MHKVTTLPPATAHRAISALMLREMSATYGRSPGGWLWAIAEPVGAITLLAFVFALAFDAPPLGQSFVMFYATGYLPFMMFTDISIKTANAVRFSRPLLTYPSVTALDALVARFSLNLLTQLCVIGVVLVGIEAIFETGIQPNPADLAVALALSAQLAAGVGVLNCALFHRFPLWERLWQIVTRPLFVISGIFFLIEDIPAEYREAALMNPLLHLTAMTRAALYPTYDAALANPLYVSGAGLGCLCLGLLLLRTTQRDLANG